MNPEYRSLLMRSNRLLGAQLVEHNLIKLDDLEAANEKLLDLIGGGSPRQRTVLGILAYDLNAVKEEEILLHQRKRLVYDGGRSLGTGHGTGLLADQGDFNFISEQPKELQRSEDIQKFEAGEKDATDHEFAGGCCHLPT